MIKRTNVAALVLSASVLVGIAVNEGYREDAYIPIPGDVPTYGFGSTENVHIGDKITPERALVRLLDESNKYANAVKRCANVPMYQYEFDAYVSLTYNIGIGAFCKSTLAKHLKNGEYKMACDEILKWDKAGGKTIPGLSNRRQREHKMCLGGMA